MRKLFPLLVIVIIATIAVAACNDGDEPSDEVAATQEPTAVSTEGTPATAQNGVSATPDLTPTPAPTPAQAAAQAPAAKAQEAVPPSEKPTGGTFRRLWADPPTLDPHLTSDTTSAFLVVEIFSGLVTLSTDLQLVPDIAERWNISNDGLVYTFFLRPEAKFHDGKRVTAHDFKWSMERASSPDTASPVADTYLNDIVGAEDVFEGRATEISGITVIDDHTLQITIDAPKAYFLAKMTYPTAYVLDQENVESGGRNWFDNPNGTGPFRLKEYKIGERMVFERNELYYREPASLDSIVMNLAGGQAMAMYENDEIDITGVGLFDLDRVLDPENSLNRELVVAPPDFNISYIGFNTSMPPFDDLNFRLALNHAIDKELIAKEVLSDLVVPAYGILPPGFPAYNPGIQGLRFDPALAQQLLADSRYANPDSRPPIVISVPGTGGTIGLDLEVILEMWRQVLDVEVEIQQEEWATYLQDLNRSRFQAFAGIGWEADYPDPQDFLDILFHSESSINHGDYSNPEVDSILEEARVEQDVVRRTALYRQAEKLIIHDAAWVPLWYQGERYALIKPYVKGYELTPMIIPKLRQVFFE